MADWRKETRRAAKRHGLDPNVFERQIKQESGFNPRASSPAGARGIAQIMPATARSWGVNPDDPKAALNAAAKNMAAYVRKYGGYRNALVAYNAGPGRVGGSLPAETQHYLSVILPNGEPSGLRSGPPRPTNTVSGPVKQTGAVTTDTNQAIIDQMLSGKGSKGLLAGVLGRLSTGKYDRPAKAAATGGTPAAPRETSASGGYPLSKRGSLIGTPFAGTHNLGNWQSDNAVDIGVPTGTIVAAVRDGVVEKVRGSYAGGSSRFDGFQVTVRLADGNRVFYTHLSKAGVKAGQRVRAGQSLGRSGAANGVQHLHMGVERGDPRKLIGQGR